MRELIGAREVHVIVIDAAGEESIEEAQVFVHAEQQELGAERVLSPPAQTAVAEERGDDVRDRIHMVLPFEFELEREPKAGNVQPLTHGEHERARGRGRWGLGRCALDWLRARDGLR